MIFGKCLGVFVIKDPSSRIIPRWAAGIVALMVRNAPPIVSLELVEQYFTQLGEEMNAKVAMSRLVNYGWLRRTNVLGAYAFVLPGTDEIVDPYVDLRAWSILHPEARFYLAGDSAAWHLGYLNREPERSVIWYDSNILMPKKMRMKLEIVKTSFPSQFDFRKLGPSSKLLRRRHLDLLEWSKGLPAFGPEALLVQIAARPASFTAWVDLAGRLEEFAGDIDIERLTEMLPAVTNATRQRIVYLLKLGRRRGVKKLLPKVLLPVKIGANGPANWDATTAITDYLVAPLLNANSKA